MNTTESLDGTVKSPDLSSATSETAVPGDASITENKRRRLVRSAVAFAPLVLTLRSGGVMAAASCTGLKATARTLGDGLDVARPGKISQVQPNTTTVEAGDICVLQAQACETDPDTRVLTSSLTAGNAQQVASYTNPSLPRNKTYLVCGTADGPDTAFIGKNIAILSSGAASSIVG